MDMYHDDCCGINHIVQVGSADSVPIATTKLEDLRHYVNNHHGSRGVLLTMNLTNRQLAREGMKKAFLPGVFKMGWKLVTRFRNPNSGNIVNVFHYTKALRTGKLNRKYRPANIGD